MGNRGLACSANHEHRNAVENRSKKVTYMARTKQKKFERMVKALSGDVFRYAYFLCRNRALAEDLAQETFTRAWRFLDNLRDESKAKSWLLTTVRREYARQFERYQPIFEDLEVEQVRDERELDGDIFALRRHIIALPLRYRETLVLQVIGGYSGAEIARMLDVPRATVNTRLFRARQHLKKALESGALPSANRDRV